MIAEIGHFALVLALMMALVQSLVPLIGAARGHRPMMAVAQPAATGQFLMTLLAFGALTWAFVVSDFTVLNVVQNSHSAKPMIYKISGVWGNHEGSMVLWVLILALFGAMVAWFGSNLPDTLRARVLAVQGMVGVGFLLFVILTSNPFERVIPPPLDGTDLNPLLQDPGLAFHPPFLYLGYVGFSMAFSFAVAALIEGRVDPAWARWVRPWTLVAWGGLTLGIALGSYWAYYELGWGGWWFWDPVENASLMPWLTGTALLHSAIVVEKRDALKSWTILLAIITFGLALMGTFLVRSGVLTSVHAFALDPDRGIFILGLMVLAVGLPLILFAIRAPQMRTGGLFAPISREGALVLNNLLLATATATVFIGTLYPLFLDVLGGSTVSVGPPFFDATFVPLMIPLVAAMVVGPMLPWKRADLAGALARMKVAALLTAIILLATLWLTDGGPVMAYVGIALASWALIGAFAEIAGRVKLARVPPAESWRRAKGLPRATWGSAIAHAGVGIAIFGMVGTEAWTTERIQAMRPGDTMDLAGYRLVFQGVEPAQGPNYISDRARLELYRGDRHLRTLTPEKRWYPVAQMPTTQTALYTTPVSDIYAVMGEQQSGGGWTIRVYHHPMVPWIWLGCVVMVLGGACSLTDRRLRVGVPTRRRAPAPAGGSPQPAE